jgi:hypothetical protein
MKVYGFVGRERGKNDLRGLLQALNGQLSEQAFRALLFGGEKVTDADVQITRFLFLKSLRLLVDSWIDSCKTAEYERPWERIVTTSVESHLMAYVQRNPPALDFTSEGPFLLVAPCVWERPKQLPAFARTKEFFHGLGEENRERASQNFPFAFDVALALFLQLLDSPERTRLFRCDGCGVYFMRTRSPKKDPPIYHGSWCAKCKNKGGAERTKNSRERRTAELVGWAADAWEQWKDDRKHGPRMEWILNRVNDRLGNYQNHIARNWVTRHKGEIEAEVERRTHGTQKTR